MPFSRQPRSHEIARRVFLVAAFVALAGVLTGCWDRIEVNDLAFITGVALDKEEPDALKLTVALAVPSNITPPGSQGSGPAEPENTTKAAAGRTVTEVLTRIQEKTARRLFWAHNALILIGEDLARDGIVPVLDFFSRQRQPRLQAILGVVPGRAEDMLASHAPIEKNVPSGLVQLSKLRTGPMVKMLDFLEAFGNEGIEPHIARMVIVRTGAGEPESLGMAGSAANSSGEEDPSKGNGDKEGPWQLSISGAAIFQGDRMIGFLDEHEARAIMWLRNSMISAWVTVTLGEPGRWVAFELRSATSELTPRFDGERIIIEARIEAVADVAENPAGVDTAEPDVIQILQEELAEVIAVRIEDTVLRVQRDFGTDVFGFGDVIRRFEPKRWKGIREGWGDIFPTVELDVTVEATIRETGLSGRPLALRDGHIIDADQLGTMLIGR